MVEFILFALLIILGAYAYNIRQLLANTIDLMNKNTETYNEAFIQDRARIEELELAGTHANKRHRKL